MSILVVSGTGTGVGKTVVTAALAALARCRGAGVAAVKPAQTGLLPGQPGSDLDEIRRLSGVTDTRELTRYPDPLSPEAAARRGGLPPLELRTAVDWVRKLSQTRDLVLVEGAGGLLVRYDPAGATIADLAVALEAKVVVVTEAGLGTLNYTALTLEALAARGLSAAGVVIGCWPADPGLAELSNLTDLAAISGAPLAGVLPAGCGQVHQRDFADIARSGLAAAFGGNFDFEIFLQAQARQPGRRRGGSTP